MAMDIKTYRAGLAFPTPVFSTGEPTREDWLAAFKEKFQIKILSMTPEEMVFDMIGIDASIANAFRRILLSEVPTMAIESVWISTNTSILQDEVLAHRLGLIPIRADPRRFEFKAPGDEGTTATTLVFKLEVAAERPEGFVADPEVDDTKGVYSRDLIWLPQGPQETELAETPVAPVHPDILIAKLKPGQQISCELHAIKGRGKEHAKWSPVSTASYRLLPELRVSPKVVGPIADELVAKCPLGVYDIEDMGGEHRAYAARPRSCTVCRECIRAETSTGTPWADLVEIHRVADHFIFSIESTGALEPQVLMQQAIEILADKCRSVLAGLE